MRKNIFFFGIFFMLLVGTRPAGAFSLSDLNLGLDQVKINYTKNTAKKITLTDVRNAKDLQVRLSANLTAIKDSDYFKVFLHSSNEILAPKNSDFILDGGQIDRISKLSKTSYVLQITPIEGAKQVLIQVEAEQMKDVDGNSNDLASNEVVVHVARGNDVGGEKLGDFEELSEDGTLKTILNSILGSQPTTNKNIQTPAQLPVSAPSPAPAKKPEEDKVLTNSWMMGLWQSMSGLFGRGGAGTGSAGGGAGNNGNQGNGNGNFSGNPGNGGGPAADTGNRDTGRTPDRGGDPVKPDNTQPTADPVTPPPPKFTDEVKKEMEAEVQKIYNIVDQATKGSPVMGKNKQGQDAYFIEGEYYTQQQVESMRKEALKIQEAIKKQEVYVPPSTPDPTSDMYTTDTADEPAKLRERHDELERSLPVYEQQEGGGWIGKFENEKGVIVPDYRTDSQYEELQMVLADLKKKLRLPADTAPTKEGDVDLLKGGPGIEVEKVGVICDLVGGREENCSEPGTSGQGNVYRVTVKKGDKQTSFFVNQSVQLDAKMPVPVTGGGFVNQKGRSVLAMPNKDYVVVLQGRGNLEKGKLMADEKDKIRLNKDNRLIADKPINFTPPVK